jgi:hypothetical protein
MTRPRSVLSIVLLILLASLAPLAYPALGLSMLAFDPIYYQQMQLSLGWSPSPQLDRMDQALSVYFQGREPLPSDLRDQFQTKEQVHLADLAWLLGVLRTLTIVIWATFLGSTACLFWHDPRWARKAVPWVLLGTLLFLVVAGSVIALFFDTLFLQFHLVTFSNDAWMLGPDYLIFRLFPPELFYRSILPYAFLVAFLLFISYLFTRLGKRKAHPPAIEPDAPKPRPGSGSVSG